MNINISQVGKVVYLLRSYYKEQRLTPYVIKSIGKKYLKVCPLAYGRNTLDFDITDNFRYAGSCPGDYKLYFSQEEYKDELKKKEIEGYISHYFSSYTSQLSLEQLIKIKDIIDSNNEK
jgi:hypothetical protein